ncbi:MAG: cytochrome c [Alphaproteobacteria bacterium]|nr:cytochrome c [Alphaproteobacteria bacterium]
MFPSKRTLIAGAAVLAGTGAAYLMFGLPGGVTGTADPGDAGQVALGKEVYGTACASCHGVELEGQADWRKALPGGGFPAPPHDETGHTWHHADEFLFRYTKLGAKEGLGVSEFKSNMAAFRDMLSDAEIWAVLAFIKSRWPPAIRQRQERIDQRNR